MKNVWTARQKEITYGTKIAIFNKTGRNSGRNMVCRIQRALNFVPAAQSLQTVKGMGIGMNTVKPFYESRKKVYDCHVWWHPNFPFHLHKHMEFVHVTEGEMDATVAGVNYHLITGDCLMIYPNQLHSYSSVGEVGMLLIIADMDSIGEFQEELTYYDMESPCFQKSMLSRYGQMVLDILADIGLHKELRPFRQDKGLLMALLADMYENIPVIKKDKPSDLNITQKLLQYINDNITGELTAQKVAKELGISPYYLSHIFSSQLNISFPSYVAQQRMILACNLLKDSRKTVTEISYECGFPNMRTFHRCFQKRYECTPTQWRERSHKGTDEKKRHQLWNQEKVESENSLE